MPPCPAVGPATRGILHSNWKVGAENYGGDGYHVTTTHRSPIQPGMFGNHENFAKLGPLATGHTAFCVEGDNGHLLRIRAAGRAEGAGDGGVPGGGRRRGPAAPSDEDRFPC